MRERLIQMLWREMVKASHQSCAVGKLLDYKRLKLEAGNYCSNPSKRGTQTEHSRRKKGEQMQTPWRKGRQKLVTKWTKTKGLGVVYSTHHFRLDCLQRHVCSLTEGTQEDEQVGTCWGNKVDIFSSSWEQVKGEVGSKRIWLEFISRDGNERCMYRILEKKR